MVHPDGRVSDAELHEPILSGIDRDADARVRNIGKQQARKAGLTEAEIERCMVPSKNGCIRKIDRVYAAE